MEQLNRNLCQAMSTQGPLINFEGIEKTLRETAKKWASFCCDEYEDELLTKGLFISKAIVEFLNEMGKEDAK